MGIAAKPIPKFPNLIFFINNPFPKSPIRYKLTPRNSTSTLPLFPQHLTFNSRKNFSPHCSRARRRPIEEEEEEEEWGYNEEMAVLERYTESARDEVLIVHAEVDDEDVEVVVFKGFSSSLSHGTASDPARSVIPARAVIRSVDRVKGPFDPSNVNYIEKGLSFHHVKERLMSN